MEPARRPSQHPGAQPERGGAARPGDCRLSLGPLPRALRHPREAQVHQGLAREAAGDVARGPLPGGGEAEGTAPRACRQVPGEEEISTAEDDMGRRAEDTLLQGEDQVASQGVVPAGSVSESRKEEGTRRGDGADAHAGRQLVQEPQAKGSCRCC